MTWVLIIGVAWLGIAAVTALVVARMIHLADQRERPSVDAVPRDEEGDPRLGLDDEGFRPFAPHEATVPQPRAVDASERRAAGPHDRRTDAHTAAS